MDNESMIEPLIIRIENSKWTHPEIETIANNCLNKEDDGFKRYEGNLFDMDIKLQNNKVINIIALVGDDTFNTFWEFDDEGELLEKSKQLQLSVKDEMQSHLQVKLTEDTWSPGGEQFYFTDFGKKVNDTISDSRRVSTEYNCSFSPDVCIHRIDSEWVTSS